MVAGLREADAVPADSVHQPVLLHDAPRPTLGGHEEQEFRLTDACERLSHSLFPRLCVGGDLQAGHEVLHGDAAESHNPIADFAIPGSRARQRQTDRAQRPSSLRVGCATLKSGYSRREWGGPVSKLPNATWDASGG
jgi:hypothetical protein